jgi:alpha-glucosidase
VNSDVITNCSPPADPKLFPKGVNTDWCKAGRAVWRYTDGGDNNYEGIRTFSKLAGQLGFEYQVVEGLWHNWSSEDLKKIVDESKAVGVRLMVWEHSKNLHDPDARERFFTKLHNAGIAGAKIDFFDHEGKETIDIYEALLREAAENQLVLDFHGANKPTGQSRTWPNELTREAIRGMEASRFTQRAFHETTLPFTRYVGGHAEYTVVNFGPPTSADRPPRRGDTTAAHQIASAAVLSSELLTYSCNPQRALESPACDMIKSIPATWDETRVLPPSEISEMALYARRSGDRWFLACLNGPGARSVDVPLDFLGNGSFRMMLVRDGKDDAPETKSTTQPIGTAAIIVENGEMKRKDHIQMDLVSGGGFIARFAPLR